MAHQSLDHTEILNVRWATVDPNPMAQKREARKIEEQAAEAVRRALPEEFVREIEGRDPDAKRRRRVEGGFGLEGYEAPDQVWYARSKAFEAGNENIPIEMEEIQHIENGLVADNTEDGNSNGILSSSALAALQKQGASTAGNVRLPASSTSAPAGPLVGYGSDEESD